MDSKVAIGIDFGTSKCCVVAVRNGEVEVIPNARGQKTTPSCVAFDQSRCLVGGEAEDQAIVNPTNSVYGVKKILGRHYKDSVVQKYVKHSQVTVKNFKDRPSICVNYRGETMDLSPEIITAMLLRRVKEEAELHLGEIGGVVVSVPAYFSSGQRQAIVTASKLAGLELLDLICEPTATALAYSENKKISEAHEILVVDIGAGKLDVSVIRVSDDEIRVLAVCGDDSFGGDDLDLMLMEDILYGSMNECTYQLSLKQMLSMTAACEEAKRNLSLVNEFKMDIDYVAKGYKVESRMSRKRFEAIISTTIDRKFKDILKLVLEASGVLPREIAEVFVVGGTSRIPLIQRVIKAHLENLTLNKTVNVDEVVAHGAAILAYRLSNGIDCPRIRDPNSDPSETDAKANPFENASLSGQGAAAENEGSEEKCYKLPGDEDQTFDVVFNPYQHLGSFPVLSFGMKSSLPRDDFDEAAWFLRRFEDDSRSYEKHAEALNDLEDFCYSFKEELRSIMESTDDVLRWTSDREGVTVSESKHKKKTLITAIQKLLNLRNDETTSADVPTQKLLELPDASSSSTNELAAKNTSFVSSECLLVDGGTQTEPCDLLENPMHEKVHSSEFRSVGVQHPEVENSTEEFSCDGGRLNELNLGSGVQQSEDLALGNQTAIHESSVGSEIMPVENNRGKFQMGTSSVENRPTGNVFKRNAELEAKAFRQNLFMPSTSYFWGLFPASLVSLLPELLEFMTHIDEYDHQGQNQISRMRDDWFHVLQYYFNFSAPCQWMLPEGDGQF